MPGSSLHAPDAVQADQPTASELAIGIVGGGQLAWMLADAAQRMGVSLRIQTPGADDPAVRLASAVVRAELHDCEATRTLAQGCRSVSFENEWADLEGLAPLAAEGICFLPSLTSLEPLICKRRQRHLQSRLRLPAPRWFPLEQVLSPDPKAGGDRSGSSSSGDGDHNGGGNGIGSGSNVAVADPTSQAARPDRAGRPALPEGFAYPLMAKQASGGYDGKGTMVLRSDADLEALLQRVSPEQWLVEDLVAFERELSLVASRDQNGAVAIFPLAETHQYEQICDWVLAPAAVEQGVQAYARNIAASLLTSLDYVGVLSIEFFYGPDGLLINELAPRTHNSGHYTIEATRTSQFEQQLRIVSGQTVGPTDLTVPGALMVNLLGFERSDSDYRDQREALAALPTATLHWYGKGAARPGRKLGHLTLLLQGTSAEARWQEAQARLAEVRRIWPLPEAHRLTDLA